MKLIDVQTAAKKLNVSVTTIHRMIREPNSPLIAYKVNKGVRILAESADLCLQRIEKRQQL